MRLFETSHLIARRLDAEDVDDLLAVYGDRNAMRWVGDGEPLDRGACERWVAVTLANYETYGYGMSALVDRESGEVIGFCGIVHPGGQTEPEIKYALKSAHWGKGLATEAVRGMLDYGAKACQLAEIIATVAPGNAASLRVLEKAGMRPGADRREEDGSVTRMLVWSPEESD